MLHGNLCRLVTAAALFATLLTVSAGTPATAVGEDTGGVFVPLTPFRAGTAVIPGNGTSTFQVTGVGGVPADNVAAVAVTLSATSTDTSAASYATAYPSTQTRPAASTLVYSQETVPRSTTAIVQVGTTGKIALFNKSGNTRLYLDVQGYFTATSSEASTGGFIPVDPVRVARTDTGEGVVAGPVPVGASRDIQVAGTSTVPSDATSVYVNIIVDGGAAPGALNVGPGGADLSTGPAALRYGADGVYSGAAAVKLSGDGKVRIRNSVGNAVNLRVDVQGYFTGDKDAGGSFTALSQTTAYSSTAVGETSIAGGQTREVRMVGVAGLPDDGSAGTVSLVVTTKNWTAGGSVTVWNSDLTSKPIPPTSNFVGTSGDPDTGVTSSSLVEISSSGTVNVTNLSSNSVNVQLSVTGWFSFVPDPSPACVDWLETHPAVPGGSGVATCEGDLVLKTYTGSTGAQEFQATNTSSGATATNSDPDVASDNVAALDPNVADDPGGEPSEPEVSTLATGDNGNPKYDRWKSTTKYFADIVGGRVVERGWIRVTVRVSLHNHSPNVWVTNASNRTIDVNWKLRTRHHKGGFQKDATVFTYSSSYWCENVKRCQKYEDRYGQGYDSLPYESGRKYFLDVYKQTVYFEGRAYPTIGSYQSQRFTCYKTVPCKYN